MNNDGNLGVKRYLFQYVKRSESRRTHHFLLITVITRSQVVQGQHGTGSIIVNMESFLHLLLSISTGISEKGVLGGTPIPKDKTI